MRPRAIRLPLTLAVSLCLAVQPGRAAGGGATEGDRWEPLRLEVVDGRWLALAQPPPLLAGEEILRQLTSGLTTTFAFTVEGRGGVEGGARVEVRYHLWDEVYRTAVVEADGGVRQRELPSREALESWWRDLRLKALELADLPASLDQLRVTLDVIPFSSLEEADTQRWLSETLARAGEEPQAGGGRQAAGSPGNALGQVFNVLLATSIRRKAVTSLRWTLALPAPLAGPGGRR